ncbi:gamma-glutamyltransferase [Anaerobacillus sp. MEB173]|uniref:gamma-glutamyltransferase n=1 Tax=Anaerobacillus sp. MEB173 TaxID=3383345 RepID=UPI003F920092
MEIKCELECTNGMVVAAHPFAAESGRTMLKKGGNAFDAAIATALSLGVVDAANSGIGGYGGVALIYNRQQNSVKVIDFNTSLPVKAPQKSYRRDGPNPENMVGYKSISVPGVVAGLYALSKNFGSLQWKDLFEPAITLANEGFVINPTIANTLNEPHIHIFPETRKELLNRNNMPFHIGERVRRNNYGKSLQLIADEGPHVFYEGKLGKEIVNDIQNHGGSLDLEDLKNYKVDILDPITIKFGDYEIYGAPKNTGHFTMMQTLNIIEGIKINQYHNRSSKMIDIVARAMAWAWKDRLNLPGNPPQDEINRLIDKNYADELRRHVGSGAGPIIFENQEDHGHTTHLCTADSSGNIVSLTLTHGPLWYGSGVTIPNTGIIMNNGMALFDDIDSGALPVNNLTPTIVKSEEMMLAVGTPGARRIISTVTNFLIDTLLYHTPLDEAMNNPRFHIEGGGRLFVENHLPIQVREELEQLGYELSNLENQHFYGPASSLATNSQNTWVGVIDKRFEGGIAGY